MKCELLVYVLPQNSVDCVGRQPQCWAAVYSPALSSHDDGPLNRPHRLEILVDSNSFHEDDDHQEIQLLRRSLINSQRLNIKYPPTPSADWILTVATDDDDRTRISRWVCFAFD